MEHAKTKIEARARERFEREQAEYINDNRKLTTSANRILTIQSAQKSAILPG